MVYAYPSPLKRPQPSVTMMKWYTNSYCTPVRKYTSHPDTDTLASYPLTLYSRATIQIYRNREFTPLKAPCCRCPKPTTISLTQQKLFFTAERLLRGAIDRMLDVERNQTNIWAVNYEVGIYEPFIEKGTEFKSKNILGNQFYPFVDEFELEVVVKLLQKVGEGLNERSLNMYLQILKNMDEVVRLASAVPQQHAPVPALAPTSEVPKKQKSYQHQHQYITPISPASSLLGPSRYPPVSPHSSRPPPSLAPPNQLAPLYLPPPAAPIQLPPLPRIIGNKPPLRSFNNMKDLFELFDKIEQGSYVAARLMEAYAETIVNEACIDCWAKSNIIDDDGGDDADFVDPCPFPPTTQQHADPSHPLQGVQLSTDRYVSIPIPMQQNCELPGQRKGIGANPSLPLEELGNNVRNPINRTREVDEGELERRWKERARKREAAKASQLVRSKANIGESIINPKWGGENKEIEVIIID